MGPAMTPVARALLIACVLAFGVQYLLGDAVTYRFALWPLGDNPGGLPFRPWQVITYAFLHGSFTHLFFNMFALYMFGPEIERLIGIKRFTLYYFVCVIGAALVQLWVQSITSGPTGPTVGASGGIFGLLLAYGMAFPRRKLMLIFPPIPMPAWLFVTLYGLLELVLGVSGAASDVAHFAHLGGMLGGLLLILYWRYRAPRRPNFN
ncbi:MAG: rhomboid family intramembrane serine protease [Pseudoxanthomonas sp.]